MIRALVLMGAVVAGPALACSPSVHTPSEVPQNGPSCSVTWFPDEIRSIGLGPARDLGKGYVGQIAADGNGCYSEINFVLMDCKKGEVLVIGPDNFDLTARSENKAPVPFEVVLKDIETAATGGIPLTLDAVAARAETAGLETRLRVRTTDAINFNGQSIGLTCACATLYPDLKPVE